MNVNTTSGSTTPPGPVRVLQTLFTVLACACLLLGSVLISVICLGKGILVAYRLG